MSYKILLSFLWAALFIQTLMADEVTLQNGLNGYTGCEDSYIATNGWGTVAGFSPTANNGTNAELKVHRESCWSLPIARAAIKFNLSSIPANATIQSAILSVYVFAHGIQNHTGGAPNNAAKSIYRITATWTESAITWNNQPAFNATAVAANTNTAINVWEDYDVTSAIKDMIENGGTNYGFILKFPSETSYKGARIRSSEYTTTTYGPKLKITYTIGSDTQAPQVAVTSPNGGEILKAGASHNITWTATDNVGVVSRAIYFTSNSGTAWTKVDSAATNTGTFAWTVPNVSSKTCKVRILAYDAARNIGNDMSDTLFFIDAQAPQVSVTAPKAGDTLKQGTVFAVKWTATDDISITSRAIYYSTNNGTAWTKIDSALTNTGTLNWTVPNVTSSTCLIRVDAYDPVRNKGTAQSGVFRIEPPTGIIPNNIMLVNGITYQITVTNIQGKELLSCNINNINQWNQIRSSLPSGVHFIRIKASDRSITKKLWFVR